MGDLEAMGGGEGGDEVTLTLDKDTAQKLYDLLGAQLGGGEEAGGGVCGGGGTVAAAAAAALEADAAACDAVVAAWVTVVCIV